MTERAASTRAGESSSQQLERTLGPTMLAIYGAGTILGAGIFVLIGKVTGTAGYWAPLAFLLAAVVAGFNGMVYAELSTRSPDAGGPSDYIRKAFGRRWLANVLGWMIVATGVVSAATITTGFSGYLTHFVDMQEWIPRTLLLVVLGGVAVAGVKQSAWFMALTTTLGLAGLGMVIYAGFWSGEAPIENLGQLAARLPDLGQVGVATGVLGASFLAVYAFIGFEDMVHLAEEVRKPSSSMPLAIAIAIGVAAVLYVVVSVASLFVLEPQAMKQAKAPLVEVVEKVGMTSWPLVVLSLAIILNGALAQIIMATRVIYSMGETEGAPDFMARVSSATDTPLIATVAATGVALLLALFFPLQTLATITSFIMLLVFAASNASLIALERERPDAPFDTPRWLPWVGLVLSLVLLVASFLQPGGGGH